MSTRFPPLLEHGCRVWTTQGFREHGPADGPKVDVGGNQAGTMRNHQLHQFQPIPPNIHQASQQHVPSNVPHGHRLHTVVDLCFNLPGCRSQP